MRRTLLVIVAVLGLTALAGQTFVRAHTARAAPPRPLSTKHLSWPESTVMEWFSQLHPHSRQLEVVYARVFAKNIPVKGARLAASVRDGNHVLLRLKGGTTNRAGQGHISFRIPRVTAGTTLTVRVTLTFHRHVNFGMNQLVVS
ncbi:MAG: hypothetical protein ACR2JC_11985 [Chloroflexota bacterium]|nr:MAG: hypothetical protein DLM70_00205 [Chloroflexota bacterium]